MKACCTMSIAIQTIHQKTSIKNKQILKLHIMKNTNKIKKNNHFSFLAVAAMSILTAVTFSACNNKEDEGELITTVKLSLSVAGGTPMVHTWQDLDGAGGNAPVLPDTIKLGQITPGGNAYVGTLEFWNEQNGTKEDITLEVKNEAHDQHEAEQQRKAGDNQWHPVGGRRRQELRGRESGVAHGGRSAL